MKFFRIKKTLITCILLACLTSTTYTSTYSTNSFSANTSENSKGDIPEFIHDLENPY